MSWSFFTEKNYTQTVFVYNRTLSIFFVARSELKPGTASGQIHDGVDDREVGQGVHCDHNRVHHLLHSQRIPHPAQLHNGQTTLPAIPAFFHEGQLLFVFSISLVEKKYFSSKNLVEIIHDHVRCSIFLGDLARSPSYFG